MNIRVIDPGKKLCPATWQRDDVFEDELDEEDDDPEPASDDRFCLLIDLKSLALAYLRKASDIPEFARRAEGVATDITALRKLMADAGLPVPADPRVDLPGGFAALAAQAAADDFDPFASEADLLTGALVLNALGLAVVQAFLCESDASRWRPALLTMHAADARFEGRLDAALGACGQGAVERASELRALASAPASAGQRLWSFDLLRMATSRLLCGGQRGQRGGFFPDGMSG